MSEEAIFAGALEKSTGAERDAYLDSACSGDAALRRRVEALLNSHEEAAGFLGTPVVQIAAEALAGEGRSADTQPEPPGDSDTIRLDFLAPSEDPQALGRIKEYTVTEVIGRGGMGIVLKARDASLDRVVAIKVLAPELAGNATARKRFLREAKTAAAVTHQHVVTIHAVGEDRLPYLVMECVSGQSLQDKLDQQGPLELREVLRIGTQVASGLAAAHAHGVIHRDIKPANILLENGIERVRITDFGLARAVDDVAMTRTGEVAGTPQYMSPEQAQGQPVDARSDLFSFGSVLYAICTGRPPFRAETTIDAIRRVCDDAPRPIREINAEVPQPLVEIMDRLLAKRPEERFQTAQEVADVLGQLLAQVQQPSVVGQGTNLAGDAGQVFKPSTRVNSARKPTLRQRRWLTVAAAALLCLAGGFGLTEATGVTQLSATVIRIFTPEGTLVIEADDPNVQVTIEGDGGLVITTAGGQHVRLPAGSTYKLRAARDGKPVPLDRDLVTITQGQRQVVKVRLETETPALQPGATVGEIHCFRGHAGPIHSVSFSQNGDQALSVETDGTIIQWDLRAKRELRRFTGYSGSIACAPNTSQALVVDQGGTLVLLDLETGNEVQRYAADAKATAKSAFSRDGRFALSPYADNSIRLWDVASGKEIKRLVGHGEYLERDRDYAGQVDVVEEVAFTPDGERAVSGGGRIVLLWDLKTGQVLRTFKGHKHGIWSVAVSPDARRVAAAGFGAPALAWDPETAAEVQQFAHTETVTSVTFSPDSQRMLTGIGKPAYAMILWDVATGQALHRFQGHANTVRSVAISRDGRQALSGSWDGTVRLWQLPEPEAQEHPFVLLGGKGVAEREFRNLADVVRDSDPGDTIEIRGNGPFVTEPIKINRPLVIRAGDGFRPVVQLEPTHVDSALALIESDQPLVLEGLELQRVDPASERRFVSVVHSSNSPIYVANCRFLAQPFDGCSGVEASRSPVCEIRNSDFPVGWGAVVWDCPSGGRGTLENCLLTGDAWGLVVRYAQTQLQNVSIRFAHNTSLSDYSVFLYVAQIPDALRVPTDQPIVPVVRLTAAGNVFHGPYRKHLWLALHPEFAIEGKPLPDDAAQSLARRLLAWDDQRNLYAPTHDGLLRTKIEGDREDEKVDSPWRLKTLDEWNEFWGLSDTGSFEGLPRYRHPEASFHSSQAVELVPEDFRLLPDTPGYQAGEDGKDLGADVDLVGPGEAYTRWKQTPDYQQWLRDTGQAK